jgi:hypothetical protein
VSRTLHIVPHTHWDREWHLPFQLFRIRLVHLMDQLLDMLDRDGSYRHFMLDGQTIVLDDYLEIRPERRNQISQFVRWGRLSIGPWHVLPDEFLVGPESLIRNLMEGDRICHQFGAKMMVGYVPDPFGHIGQLPQILKGFGIDVAVFRRGLAEEPTELEWAAPDGSRVLVCYLRESYDNAARLPTADPEAFVATIRTARDKLAPFTSTGHILLLAGTDHQEAQPELPELIAYANAGHLDGDRLVHGTLADFCEAVQGDVKHRPLPAIEGELRSPQRHHLLPAVLSARMWIKQRNDAIETLLTRWVEPYTAWAELIEEPAAASGVATNVHLTGYEPLSRVRQPEALIHHAWRLLLENHPHDSICGCSIDQVHREMGTRFDQAEQIGAEMLRQSLTTIVRQVDTASAGAAGGNSATGQPLVVFNPVAGPRTDAVAVRTWLPAAPDAVQVFAPDGQMVPHQVVSGPAEDQRPLFDMEVAPKELLSYVGMVEGGRLLTYAIHDARLRRNGSALEIAVWVSETGEPNPERMDAVRAQVEKLINADNIARCAIRVFLTRSHELAFVAPRLPAYGYATFTIRPAQKEKGRRQPAAASRAIETDLLRVEADPADGTLTLTDKVSGAVYSRLNCFVDGGDRGDEYNYCPPKEDRLISGPAAPPGIRVLEVGPARHRLEVSQVYRLPRALQPDRQGRSEASVDVTLVSQASLYPEVRRVDIRTTLENVAQDHRLRVHFPVPAAVDHAHTGAHFHVMRRPVPSLPEGLDTTGWVEQPVPTVPQRGWADVSDGRTGLMLANRGLPEVEFISENGATVIALTLLRSVGWLSRGDLACRQGHAGPALATPEAQCLGRHTFEYALIPHQGDWQAVCREADAFRAPLRAMATGTHAGSLPLAASILEVDPPVFHLTAIKQFKNGLGPSLVVRGVNLSEKSVSVRLRPWRAFEQVTRANLNEDFVEPLVFEPDGSVVVPAAPWEVVTVRWRDG